MSGGLECVALVDGRYAATFRFRDRPRADGASFIDHLKPKHHFRKVMIVSGDRESEVRYLAERFGIGEVFAEQAPEQKLELVRRETARARTLFVGDGINDAPALTAATVGLAFGRNSDITAEAAGAVILENSLLKVDEFFHISRRMRTIALESAVGGMALGAIGIAAAAGPSPAGRGGDRAGGHRCRRRAQRPPRRDPAESAVGLLREPDPTRRDGVGETPSPTRRAVVSRPEPSAIGSSGRSPISPTSSRIPVTAQAVHRAGSSSARAIFHEIPTRPRRRGR